MTALLHCMYASAATQEVAMTDLTAILTQSRVNNARLGVTGMLLFTAGSFFQVLEGDPVAVATIFAKVARDPRHACITVINEETIAQRDFATWSMGAATLTLPDLSAVVGGNDFFGAANCFAELGNGRAKKLLAAFASGRWRTHLSDQHTPGIPQGANRCITP